MLLMALASLNSDGGATMLPPLPLLLVVLRCWCVVAAAKKVINYDNGSDLNEGIAADMAELDDLRQLAASAVIAQPKKVCLLLTSNQLECQYVVLTLMVLMLLLLLLSAVVVIAAAVAAAAGGALVAVAPLELVVSGQVVLGGLDEAVPPLVPSDVQKSVNC